MPETRVLLKHAEDPELRTIAGYKRYGGYATLEKAYKEMEAGEVLQELNDPQIEQALHPAHGH